MLFLGGILVGACGGQLRSGFMQVLAASSIRGEPRQLRLDVREVAFRWTDTSAKKEDERLVSFLEEAPLRSDDEKYVFTPRTTKRLAVDVVV